MMYVFYIWEWLLHDEEGHYSIGRDVAAGSWRIRQSQNLQRQVLQSFGSEQERSLGVKRLQTVADV